MSRINNLIAELAPDGVEYRGLGELATFRRGTSITKALTTRGDIPVVAGGRSPAYYHGESNRPGDSIVIAGSGAYAGYVSYWTDPVFVSDAFTIHPAADQLNAKYLYYFLTSIQKAIHATHSGGGVPHVHGKHLAGFRIPVPPLEVQREIVRILDNFTELEAALEAELKARRRQYEYYRDRLLTFEEAAA